jgi:hypothetical protein
VSVSISGIGNTEYIIQYIIQLIRIIHNIGGFILYYLYYLGYSRSRSRRLLLLSAITISVHMCVWAYVVYI